MTLPEIAQAVFTHALAVAFGSIGTALVILFFQGATK